MRVTTRVEEVPVSEQVTLREETVDVHRRPVNREVTDADVANLQQGSFEVRERAEQAIVDKQARVVEEVVINKQVEDRTETVQDTVRRTDVDVQQLQGDVRTSDYAETGRISAAGVTGVDTTTSTNDAEVAGTGRNAGLLERGTNAAERLTNTDLDRDGDAGQRDPRNNS